MDLCMHRADATPLIYLHRIGRVSIGKFHGLFHRPRAAAPWLRASPSPALAPRGWQPQASAAALPGTDRPAAWGRAAGAARAARRRRPGDMFARAEEAVEALAPAAC